jgi:hypothetical protein
MTGTTSGQLGASHFGGEDAFVTKLDAAGNVEWLRQFGTTQANPFARLPPETPDAGQPID